MLRFHTLPGHCLAIMLAAWRGQSLVPSRNVAGLERSFNPERHPELAVRETETCASTVSP